MKNLIFFLGLSIVVFIITSCGDSLGYDPKVQITRILEDTTDNNPDPIITKFQVDSVFFNFMEVFHAKNGRDIAYDWPFKANKKVITIDTSNDIPEISIDLDFESTLRDDDMMDHDRIDRVVKFNTFFSSSLTEPIYRLDNNRKDTRWIELFIKVIPQEEIYRFNGSEMPSQIVMIEHNKRDGSIKLLLNVELAKSHFRSKKFYGYIMIYYRK